MWTKWTPYIYTNRCGKRKVILGPAGRALRTRLAGKKFNRYPHELECQLWWMLAARRPNWAPAEHATTVLSKNHSWITAVVASRIAVAPVGLETKYWQFALDSRPQVQVISELRQVWLTARIIRSSYYNYFQYGYVRVKYYFLACSICSCNRLGEGQMLIKTAWLLECQLTANTAPLFDKMIPG